MQCLLANSGCGGLLHFASLFLWQISVSVIIETGNSDVIIRILHKIKQKFVSIIVRLPWVTVCHEYIGAKSYQVSPFTSVQDIKQFIFEETNLPVKEQRLTHNGRVVSYSFFITALFVNIVFKASQKYESA